MKKLMNLMIVLSAVPLLLTPVTVLAEDTVPQPEATPVLSEISFRNAEINEEFSPFINDYTLTLEDSTLTPTLKSYEVKGTAEVFVTYSLDEAKHQTGIVVTLEYESGTTVYDFTFSNAQTYSGSANNCLYELNCRLGEVYPAINDKDTEYKLYIPSDLTTLQLSAATQDIGAYCEIPKEIELNADQEPNITVTVTASNGETRQYNFKVKRLNKTSEQVRAEMNSPDFETLVKGELFYQKPSFIITVLASAGGILLIVVFVSLAKRLTVKAEDADEVEFFDDKK